MSMKTLEATGFYITGDFYKVINVYGTNYPIDLGGVSMLASSYLAIGNFMKFQLVMEYYLDEKSFITKIPIGQSKEEAFYFGTQWYKELKSLKALQELYVFYKENGYLEKKTHDFNEMFRLMRFTDNLQQEAYKLLQTVDLLNCMGGLYHMEAVENIGVTLKSSVYNMKKRLLNVVASSLEGPSVELFEKGIKCLEKLEAEAI